MLSDAFLDFTSSAKEPDADLPALLAEFEDALRDYSDEFWGYNPKLFPLLRKAARWHAAGKLSWRELHAIDVRLILCFVCLEGTEETLVEDLHAFVRSKPTIDLRTMVGAACRRRRRAAAKERKAELPPPVTAITSTGVVLSLVT